MKDIVIVGTGGFAQEVLWLIDRLGLFSTVKGFLELDELWETQWKDKFLLGVPVLPISEFNPSSEKCVIGIGDSKIREKIVKQFHVDTEYPTLIDPASHISRWAHIGTGCIISAGTIITTQISIGNHSQLNLNTTIGHDCKIGEYFTTAPATNISGECIFGKHVYFGTGSATRDTVSICENVVIGMGAMVVKNINEPGTYVGIPARKI